MQISSAFGQVQSALSFFVTAYSSIADWKAVLDRLAGFEASIDWAQSLDKTAPRVEFITDGGTRAPRRGACRRAAERRRRSCACRTSASSPASACWSRGRQAPARPACSARSAACGRSAPARSAFPRERTCWCCRSALIFRSARLRGALAYPGPETSFSPQEIEEVVEAIGPRRFQRPARRHRLLGRQALRRRAAAALDRARAAAEAAMAVARRGDERARRGGRGSSSTGCCSSGCPNGHHLDRSPLEPRPVPWPLLRAQARRAGAPSPDRGPAPQGCAARRTNSG